MGDVVTFPAKSVRDWTFIERSLDEKLASYPYPVRARVRKRMKSFFELLDPDFSFPMETTFPSTISRKSMAAICADIGEKVGATIEKRLQDFTTQLFIERLNCEIDFCRELGML